MTRLAIYTTPFPAYLHSQTSSQPTRCVSPKHLNGVRLNWFVFGALFGAVLSFMLQSGISKTLELASLAQRQNHAAPIAMTVADSAKPQTGIRPLPALAMLERAGEPSIEAVIRPDDREAAASAPEPGAPKPDAAKPGTPEPQAADATEPALKTVEHTLEKGDTLLNVLVAHDVAYQEASRVIDALRKHYNPRDLRPGHSITLRLAPGGDTNEAGEAARAQVADMAINLSAVDRVELTRLPEGAFIAEKTEKPLKPVPTLAGGTIANSLFETGYANGIPDGVLAELVQAYSYDVDFQREIQRGDQVEVLFDRLVTEDGEEAGYGAIHYAMLKLRGKPIKIYRYETEDGFAGFYHENGESVVKALLKTPVNGARISSGFGKRRHPILGYTKMHKGTDFAAPTGTPIYAAGDGVVKYVGRKGGYGNYIKIRHSDTYDTAYAHLHRYASDMRPGKKVKQGQVIGYVGSTGRSTGPHLHYEVHKNGRQVNPMKEKFETGKQLKGKQLAAFKASIGEIRQQVATLPRHKTTLASSQ